MSSVRCIYLLIYIFLTKWFSLFVEGLLSTGPTQSIFFVEREILCLIKGLFFTNFNTPNQYICPPKHFYTTLTFGNSLETKVLMLLFIYQGIFNPKIDLFLFSTFSFCHDIPIKFNMFCILCISVYMTMGNGPFVTSDNWRKTISINIYVCCGLWQILLILF